MRIILLIYFSFIFIITFSARSQNPEISNNSKNDPDEEFESRNSFNREKWFYDQRMYPNNYLPYDCYGKAVEERNLLRAENGFVLSPDTPWRNIGPTPGFYFTYTKVSGRITTVRYDPVNPNIVYFGGAFGGVWKSTNGGNSFFPITDKEVSLSTGSIFVDPANPNIIYYGTGEATYSGASYYGRGILRSTNGGDTWENFTAGLPDQTFCSRFVIKPGSSNFLYAAMGAAGLYWSTNTGVSWSLLVIGRCDDVVFSPNGTTGYMVGSGSGYRKSTDGGVTFLPNASLPMGMRNHIAICRDNPAVLYSSVYDAGAIKVYKSTNAGNNFTQVAIGTNFDGGQAWYDFYMHVNPFDPNYAYVGSIDIWRTTNGGSSFQNITNSYGGGIVHADQHNMDFNPQNPNELMAVNDGGIWKSTNRGTNWINLNEGLSLMQFYRITSNPSNPLHIMGGTQDNGTQYTFGTSNWVAAFEGDGGEVCFQSQNTQNILAETQYNGIKRSTNGGITWIDATNGINGSSAWVGPFLSHPSQPGVFYTARERVFKTTDNGASWSAISSGTSGIIREMAISKSDPNIMYAASGALIFKSVNGGSSFLSVTTGLVVKTITSVYVHPDSSNVVVLTYSGFGPGKIYKTTNGGSSWINISGNLPDTPVNDVLIYYPGVSTSVYFAATDVGVFHSSDYGTRWTELADSLPNTVAMHLDYNQQYNIIRVGTHGRGVWETGNPIGIINYNNNIPAEYSLGQNYPNPFNPLTIIKYDILKTGFVKLAVYDILGRELQSLVNTKQEPGSYTVQFEGRDLSSGVYFYKLMVNGYAETRKMIITK